MSNAKRPNMAKQHTRTTKAKAEAEQDEGLALSVDGATYTVRKGDLTSLDVAALRRETGFSFLGLIGAFGQSPDIDLVAAFVWLARRIHGEPLLDYATVAQEIGYDLDIEVVDTPDPEDNFPEA